MKILKNLIFLMVAAACMVSCFDDDGSNYRTSYTMESTFEYNNLFTNRNDSLYFETLNAVGIGWQDMGFMHKLNDDNTKFQGGFILSRLKGSGTSDEDRFRVNSGAGLEDSNNYLVYYANPDVSKMPKHDVEFVASKYGTCTMIGCYVNNTKEVLEAVKNTFEDGDRLAVKMTGYLGDQKTGEQEFVLAEFSEAKDSLVTGWSPFKLDKLGDVEFIHIEIESTKPGIPAAFCLDSMVARISIEY